MTEPLSDPAQLMRSERRFPHHAILSAAALSSGLALIVSIKAHISLSITLSCLGVFGGSVVRLRWLRSDLASRADIVARIRAGAAAGAVATVGYDVSRWLIVSVAHLKFDPFHAFPLFGFLLLGDDGPLLAAWIAGTTYHYANGLMFGVGYALLLGRRDWKWGVIWGLGLEAMMLMIYPGWLHLDAVLEEFTVVSMCGHLVYGFVLGLMCQARLPKRLD